MAKRPLLIAVALLALILLVVEVLSRATQLGSVEMDQAIGDSA
jgi:hypothetical protein